MDVEKNIADIAFLEELYALRDERPILTSGEEAGSLKHDELHGRNLVVSLGPSWWNHLQRLWTGWRSKRWVYWFAQSTLTMENWRWQRNWAPILPLMPGTKIRGWR